MQSFHLIPSNTSARYAFVAGITHSAHTGLFTVLTFVVLGFVLMTRVDFSTVCTAMPFLNSFVSLFSCALDELMRIERVTWQRRRKH
jgi:hypothetical protein